MAKRQQRRRGVLLLVVLSLLVLFVLIGMTFIVVAGQFNKTTKVVATQERSGESPQQLLDISIHQILRGTGNQQSAILGHELLRDKYGTDLTKGAVYDFSNDTISTSGGGPLPAVSLLAGGQLTMTTCVFENDQRAVGYYNGCVLTFTTGESAGKSTRILRYELVADRDNVGIFQPRLVFESVGPVAAGDRFLINGIPFNGTGVGYSSLAEPKWPGATQPDFNSDGMKDPTYNLDLSLPVDFRRIGADYANGADSAFTDVPLNEGSTYLTAFLPNYSAYSFTFGVNTTGTGPAYNDPSLAWLGGMDEAYDIADFQNYFLGWVPADWNRQRQPANGIPTNEEMSHLIPSFHRPSVGAYWAKRFGDMFSLTQSELPRIFDPNDSLFDKTTEEGARRHALVQRVLRSAISRPTRWDHPNFTGSNRSALMLDPTTGNPQNPVASVLGFNPIYGPWDVDNDGNGIEDSVWVDLGLPVQQDKNGRLYKPLFAILCTDLDGRVNVNAAGMQTNIAQVATLGLRAGEEVNTPLANPLSTEPHGDGVGPFEIDLSDIAVDDAITDPSNVVNEAVDVIVNRYGDGAAGVAGINDDLLRRLSDGTTELTFPYKNFNYSSQFNKLDSTNNPASNFGSPIDLNGRTMILLSHRGLPFFGVNLSQHGQNNEYVDDPYESNLTRPNAFDSLYTDADMELLLRPYDVDASSLSTRLTSQLPLTLQVLNASTNYPASQYKHGTLTTRSFDDPTPAMQMPIELRAVGRPGPTSLGDILLARTLVAGTSINSHPFIDPTSATAGDMSKRDTDVRKMQQMFPFELLQGQKMDINRPFGDGGDNDGDGLVDEIGEANQLTGTNAATTAALLLNDLGTTLQPLNWNESAKLMAPADIAAAANGSLSPRQLYARHLYCLAMMMISNDPGAGIDHDESGGALVGDDTARALAQWAVNAVDFRDSDSIMTGFEFDVNPFNGWDVDGDLSTPDGQVVWGCERPELLITETLAWHDHATEDLSEDGTTTDTPADDDFDQRVRPSGSVFIELYNPSGLLSGANQYEGLEKKSREFYDRNNPGTGINLAAINTEGGAAGGVVSPVWRMLAFEPGVGDVDPDRQNFDTTKPSARRIYFVNETMLALNPELSSIAVGEDFNASQPPGNILPGGYMVVGSSGVNAGGRHVSMMGRRQTLPPMSDEMGMIDETRRIELQPDANGYQSGTCVFGNPQAVLNVPQLRNRVFAAPVANEMRPYSVAVIDQPRSLSISEPPQGYPGVANSIQPYEPLPAVEDVVSAFHYTTESGITIGMQSGVTHFGVTTICLQRLADPTRRYHPDLNPYITVDSSAIDLTEFNGMTDATDPTVTSATQTQFAARQRGDVSAATGIARNLWQVEGFQINPPGDVKETDADTPDGLVHFFDYLCRNSLGYLNDSYRFPVDNTAMAFTSGQFRGHPLSSASVPAFSHFTWNNRPFVSQYELMLVPKSSPYFLLRHYDMPNSTNSSFIMQGSPQNAPFRSYLNFFGYRGGFPAAYDGGGIGLTRLFDLLHVPSRYLGTEKWYNTLAAGSNFNVPTPTSGANALNALSNALSTYRAPFSRMSAFRDPGKVNLNTITHPDVWNAVASGYPAMVGGAGIVELSTRVGSIGGVNSNVDITNPGQHIDFQYPTQFYNPFRSSFSANFRPTGSNNLTGGNVGAAFSPIVEAGLLRPGPAGTSRPLFAGNDATPHRESGRNPYFMFKPVQHLANTTTNKSNVFAVWVTVGYFEVETYDPDADGSPNFDLAHPDGHALGREIGEETGDIERHRGFYIIDRSIPVGYEPGKNHNADDAIVLRRVIE
ncbi:MAG: hypothetical protein AAF497_00490 [Planctomycetota bacterium]